MEDGKLNKYFRLKDNYPDRLVLHQSDDCFRVYTPFGLVFAEPKCGGMFLALVDSKYSCREFGVKYYEKMIASVRERLGALRDVGKLVVSIPTADRMLLKDLGLSIIDIKENLSEIFRIQVGSIAGVKDNILVHQYMMVIDTVFCLAVDQDRFVVENFCCIPDVMAYHYTPKYINNAGGYKEVLKLELANALKEDALLCSHIAAKGMTMSGVDFRTNNFYDNVYRSNVYWDGEYKYVSGNNISSDKPSAWLWNGVNRRRNSSIVSYGYVVEFMDYLSFIFRKYFKRNTAWIKYVSLSNGFEKKSVEEVIVRLDNVSIYRNAYFYHTMLFTDAKTGQKVPLDVFCILEIKIMY